MKTRTIALAVLLSLPLPTYSTIGTKGDESERGCLKVGIAVGILYLLMPAADRSAITKPDCTRAQFDRGWAQRPELSFLSESGRCEFRKQYQKLVRDADRIADTYTNTLFSSRPTCENFDPQHIVLNVKDLERAAIASYCEQGFDLPDGAPVVLSEDEFLFEAGYCFAQAGNEGGYKYHPTGKHTTMQPTTVLDRGDFDPTLPPLITLEGE